MFEIFQERTETLQTLARRVSSSFKALLQKSVSQLFTALPLDLVSSQKLNEYFRAEFSIYTFEYFWLLCICIKSGSKLFMYFGNSSDELFLELLLQRLFLGSYVGYRL